MICKISEMYVNWGFNKIKMSFIKFINWLARIASMHYQNLVILGYERDYSYSAPDSWLKWLGIPRQIHVLSSMQ